MTTYRVHVLVKDGRDYEDDVVVEAINSIEASKQALQKLADEKNCLYNFCFAT